MQHMRWRTSNKKSEIEARLSNAFLPPKKANVWLALTDASVYFASLLSVRSGVGEFPFPTYLRCIFFSTAAI